MVVMEAYTDFEQVLVDKIHYRCIDVPCCKTCAHAEYPHEEAIICMVNTYYNPEIGGIMNWYVDQLGLCDKYKKMATE
jgi:hypothetical protein